MTSITRTLQTLQIAEAQKHRSLTLFPLLQPKAAIAKPVYLTLDEALQQGVARVTEVSASGSVPELRFQNDGTAPVLLLGGEELVGAKQNRILNLTILAPGKTSLTIPVSCVEAGRWQMRQPEFQASERVMPRAMRARVSEDVSAAMRSTSTRRSNQSQVWSMIAEQAHILGAASDTSAMADTFEKASLALDEVIRSFTSLDGQVGMAYCLGGKHWGMDLFDHPETLRHYFRKLLRSYGLDALTMPESPVPDGALQSFFLRLQDANAHVEAALGLGKDVRLSGDRVSGAGLDWEDRYVHLCGFSVEKSEWFESRIQNVRSRFQW